MLTRTWALSDIAQHSGIVPPARPPCAAACLL